jgi:hypothetical protein
MVVDLLEYLSNSCGNLRDWDDYDFPEDVVGPLEREEEVTVEQIH